MKFLVGVRLTAFGIFWGAEGTGAHWPSGDAALLVLVPAVAVFALAQVGCCGAARRPHRRGTARWAGSGASCGSRAGTGASPWWQRWQAPPRPGWPRGGVLAAAVAVILP